ncbi:CHAT domain-containing protein [bacterium AH-315-F03]|nr:CHAT domain-containing protein [bacterium AH-315-F03]
MQQIFSSSKMRLVSLIWFSFLLSFPPLVSNARSVDFGAEPHWELLIHQAQNVSRQRNTTAELIQRGQDSALILGRRALVENVALLGESHPTRGVIFNFMGDFAFRKGDYKSARESWLTALEINDSYSAENSQPMETSLFRLGIYAKVAGIPQVATPRLIRAVNFTQKVESSIDPHDSRLIYDLANAYECLYDYDGFYRLLKRVATVWENSPDSDPKYAIRSLVFFAEHASKPTVSNVGKNVQSQDSAVVFGSRALSIAVQRLGDNDTLIAYVENRLGDYHSRNGNYHKAYELWEKAWKINMEGLHEEHIEVQGSIYRMAGVFSATGRYAESEDLYKQAVGLRTKTQGPGHPETASMHMSLGRLYHTTADYDAASNCYLKALSIRENSIERVESDIAQSIRFLGILAYDRGDYASAERHLLRALSIRKEALGPSHALTANCADDLGELYAQWGKLQEAEDIFTGALEVRKSFLGEKHPDVAVSLERLASFYTTIGEYARARSSLEAALSILKPNLEMMELRHASILLSLADVALNEDDFKSAELYAKRGYQISEHVFGIQDHRLIPGLTLLGRVMISTGKFSEAEELITQALDIAQTFESLFQPELANVYDAYAELLMQRQVPRSALRYVKLSFEIRMSVFENGASVMSEHDAFNFERQVYKTRDRYFSMFLQCDQKERPPVSDLLSVLLASKGVASTTFYDRYRTLRSENDSIIKLSLDSLRLARAHISRLYVDGPQESSPAEYQGRLQGAIDEAERLEEALAQLSDGYNHSRRKLEPNVENLISALPKNSLLVEYFTYENRTDSRDSARILFGALTLNDQGKISIHDLGNAAVIDSAVASYRKHIRKVSHSISLPTPEELGDYTIVSTNLVNLIWSPLGISLPVNGPIYIAPDGSLNLVSFAGLPGLNNRFLVEDHPIQYVLSGNDILLRPISMPLGSGIAIFGDPDFDASPEQREASRSELVSIQPKRVTSAEKRHLRSTCDVLARKKLSRLSGTRDELHNISSIWKQNSDQEVWTYQGAQASEDAFKSNTKGMRIVHVATHGFFAGGDCRVHQSAKAARPKDDIIGENPLLLSGLYFAGANLYGAGANQLGLDDGILTAVEVSGMNLDGVEWVVLSACESGIGDIRSGEGVHGLRYAFRVAGAESVISALWEISDYDAADFMQRLYSGNSDNLAVRMREAALTRLDDLRMRNQPEHPALWAAFVASGFNRR